MSLAQEANRYLDEQAPWKAIKTERQASAKSIYTVLSVLAVLKTVLYPFLPFSSEKIHSFLGFDGSVREAGWKAQFLPPGQKLRQPQPLFVKLDEDIVAKETSRLGSPKENKEI
jgi:methionyl-tRNA synthetase